MCEHQSRAQKVFSIIERIAMSADYRADIVRRSGALLICRAGQGDVYQFEDESCLIIDGERIETTTLMPLRFAKLRQGRID